MMPGEGGSGPTVIPPQRTRGTWDYWMSPTTGKETDDSEPARRHGPGRDTQLLHHRAHRPWQIDPGRQDVAVDRGGRPAVDARPVPRSHGHRARARHHH